MVTMECRECEHRFKVNQYDIEYGDIVCPICFSNNYEDVGNAEETIYQPGDYEYTGEYDEYDNWIAADGNSWGEG